MISREEAKKLYISEMLCPAQCAFIIDELFNSIGTCGECKYYTEIYNDRTTTSNTIWVCNGHEVRMPYFFCADFERKE